MSSRYNRIRQDGEIIDLLFARSEQGLDQIQSMSFIEASDISGDDKYAALGYVTDKIAELVEKIIIKEN